MRCSGKCQCGNSCVLDHELVAQCCTCNGNHRFCRAKCFKHVDEKCVWIALHKGSHDCLECARKNIGNINE